MTALEQVLEAWRNEGPVRGFHRMMKRRLKNQWPTLYNALDALDKESVPVYGTPEPPFGSVADMNKRYHARGLTGDFTDVIPEHQFSRDCKFLKTDKGCYYCCEACNYDRHTCGGCGEGVTHLGNEWTTGKPHAERKCYE